jgi:hypothetical protein
MKTRMIVGFACLLLMLTWVEPALAGPGGKIASALFATFWGKVLLLGLTIVLSPLIIYVAVQEMNASRRTTRDLQFMAKYSPQFELLELQQRAKDCFTRVHSAWSDEVLSGVKEWMTGWYWQNQQMVHLEKWKREGLKNVCNVKKISGIKPLLFVHRNNGAEHEGSMVVIAISANLQDYLATRDGDKVVEGSKNYQEVRTIWTFTLENGAWKVSNIEEDGMTLTYTRMVKDLPSIESTLLTGATV